MGYLGLLELLGLNLLYVTQIRVSLVFGFISLVLAFYGVAAFGSSRQRLLCALRGVHALPRVHVLCGNGNNKFFVLAKTAE
jgi:hypothetical protein